MTRAQSTMTWIDGVLLMMSAIWAINFTVVKIALQDFSPLSFNALRFLIACGALAVISRMRRESWSVEGEDLGSLVGLGILANTVYQVAFIEGIARAQAGAAALILATTPVVVAALNVARGHERVTRSLAAGIGLSVFGVLFIVSGGGEVPRGSPAASDGVALGDQRHTLFGYLLLLMATICWALYTIGAKRHVHRYGAMKSTLLMMIAGTIPLVLISLPSLRAQSWTTIRPSAWGAVAFSALGAIVFCFVAWNYALTRLGSTRTAVYANVSPAIALLVAWIGLGERPSLAQGIGAVLILSGLFLARREEEEIEITLS